VRLLRGVCEDGMGCVDLHALHDTMDQLGNSIGKQCVSKITTISQR